MSDHKKENKFRLIAAAVVSAIVAPVLYLGLKTVKKKKVPNCGGCLKNCSLEAPTCRIGREKAEAWKAENS
ncbi:MAG: hypothetical protein PUC99_10465 [Eubacteriales bacterium]|jgi:hypothetical protein|nr:hypothetical protein [Eubacteriales bacterium]